MQQYLRAVGRDCLVVNFDPANEIIPPQDVVEDESASKAIGTNTTGSSLPYDVLLDVCQDVINLNCVMEELNLGPNGGLLYCLEYMEQHMDVIMELICTRLEDYEHQKHQNPENDKIGIGTYVLFDFPGQVELFTHNTSVQHICQSLTNEGNFKLAAVQLIDAHHCLESSKFISAVLLSTTTMLRLELPTVNVLSKVDLLINRSTGEPLISNLDFFTNASNLHDLLNYLDSEACTTTTIDDDYFDNGVVKDGIHSLKTYYADDMDYQKARSARLNSHYYRRYRKLHEMLCEVIEDFNLVSFLPLDIQSAESVGYILAQVDKCNGYIFIPQGEGGSEATAIANLFQCAVQAEPEWEFERMARIYERYH